MSLTPKDDSATPSSTVTDRIGGARSCRPYHPPQLVRYGDATAITKAVADTSAKPDGGGGMTNKTA